MISNVLGVLAVTCLCVMTHAQSGKGLFDPDTFRTLTIKFKQSDFLQQLLYNKRSELYIKADLVVDGKTYKDVGVRGRGGQTWVIGSRTGKLPLKIKLDEFVPGQRLMGRRSLVLGVCYERSFLREALTFRLMGKYIPAPQANFIKLLVNGTSWGVYLNIEVMNSDFLETHFADQHGNRYKGIGFRNLGPNPASYYNQRLMSSQRADSYKDLAAAMTRMSLTGTRHEAEIPIGIDVDGMHRYFACNSFLSVGDTFPSHNFYIYIDPYHSQLSILPWDVNYSIRLSSADLFPIWLRGVSSTVWLNRYKAHLRHMVEDIDMTEFKGWIQGYHNVALKEMQKETRWFFPTSHLVAEANNLVTILRNMKTSTQTRLGATSITYSGHLRTPHDPKATDTVWLRIQPKSTSPLKRVLLHVRARGYFKETPMFDDGKHQDGQANDGIYGVSIPKGSHQRFEYYFSAENSTSIAFHPSTTSYDPFHYSSFTVIRSSALIHEFVADNLTGIKDEHGEREDWIELYNPTSSPIPLGGMFLSDDVDNLKKWTLPKFTLNPLGRLIIWADDDTKDGPLHANFKLGAKEDAIYLTDRDGVTLRDYYEFENQRPDVSQGRLLDKLSPFVSFPKPTPLQPSQLQFCGSRTFDLPDVAPSRLRLEFVGLPKAKTQVAFELSGTDPMGWFLLMIALEPASFHLAPLRIQMHVGWPLLATLPIPADSKGAARIPVTVPDDAWLDGFRLSLQVLAAPQGKLAASNGLELRFCR